MIEAFCGLETSTSWPPMVCGSPPRWHWSVRLERNLIQPSSRNSCAVMSVVSGSAIALPMVGRLKMFQGSSSGGPAPT